MQRCLNVCSVQEIANNRQNILAAGVSLGVSGTAEPSAALLGRSVGRAGAEPSRGASVGTAAGGVSEPVAAASPAANELRG